MPYSKKIVGGKSLRKFALITGASGGIGAATAHTLARSGWNLYLHYNNNQTRIDSLVQELQTYDVEIIPIKSDLSLRKGVEVICNNIFQLDAMIYCSGTAPYGLLVDMEDTEIDQTIQLHVKSPIELSRNLLPKLTKNRDGQIVLISSIWGQTGAACEVLYSTVKGAQISFVKALSKETARSGVRVNCVAPGAIQTKMVQWMTEEELHSLEDDIPMGRLGLPEEVAETIEFLLSDKATYMTGQVLAINGGMYT